MSQVTELVEIGQQGPQVGGASVALMAIPEL